MKSLECHLVFEERFVLKNVKTQSKVSVECELSRPLQPAPHLCVRPAARGHISLLKINPFLQCNSAWITVWQDGLFKSNVARKSAGVGRNSHSQDVV